MLHAQPASIKSSKKATVKPDEVAGKGRIKIHQMICKNDFTKLS